VTLDEITKRLDGRDRNGFSEGEGREIIAALAEHRKNAMTLSGALRAARLSARLLSQSSWARVLIDDLIRLLQPFADGEAERLAAMAEDDRQYRVDNLVQALIATHRDPFNGTELRQTFLDGIYRDADAVMAARERYIAARAKR